jgi:hypothetical protein
VGLDDLSSQLGPLPKSDDNARLQRESLKALHKLLVGLDDLIFRDERVEDYGVDGSFELNLAGSMTNFHSQAQMKASAHVAVTNRGYIPLKVDAANLNYLLNGSSPIYILWNAQTDEFWYAWAQEENRRLLEENPSWTQQGSVTLQFRKRLTREVMPAIVERILQEGRQQRDIRDRLARATEGEQVIIRIDADSLQITDADMATSLLLASGTAIVAAGYPQQVVDLMRLVELSKRDLPRMQLTIGYAEYMLGNHWEALGHIRRAIARGQELSARDNAFLGSLRDASELHAGLIDSATYEQRLNERAGALAGLEALEAEQDALYHRYVRLADLAERSELAKNLRAVTERILNDAQAPRAIKVGANLLLLYVEGVEANLAATQTEFAAKLRGELFPGDVRGIFKTILDARQPLLQWEAKAAEALKDAYALNHPILTFQALTILLRIRVGRLFEQNMDAITHKTPYAVEPATRASIQRMLDEATKLNAVNGSNEGRLQLEELQADFIEVQGERDAAKTLAAKTYPEALAMGFGTIAEHAKRLLDDDTLLLRWQRSFQQLQTEDDDLQRANQSNEQLNRIAAQLLRSVESPPARLDVIVEHLRSFRQISRERMNWCRHLQILEDLNQTSDPKTAYSELPSRKCLCDKFAYVTEDTSASTDAYSVVEEFKLTFCTSCLARNPKSK